MCASPLRGVAQGAVSKTWGRYYVCPPKKPNLYIKTLFYKQEGPAGGLVPREHPTPPLTNLNLSGRPRPRSKQTLAKGATRASRVAHGPAACAPRVPFE